MDSQLRNKIILLIVGAIVIITTASLIRVLRHTKPFRVDETAQQEQIVNLKLPEAEESAIRNEEMVSDVIQNSSSPQQPPSKISNTPAYQYPAPLNSPSPRVPTPSPPMEIPGLTTIRIIGYWQNWDADAENDGLEVQIVYQNNLGEIIAPDLDALREYAESVYSDIPSTLSSPVQISADVKLYTFAPGTEDKGRLVFSKHYAETEVVYTAITPTVRIPKEEITADPSKDYDYGILEVTIYTPEQGSFSAIKKYIKLYER